MRVGNQSSEIEDTAEPRCMNGHTVHECQFLFVDHKLRLLNLVEAAEKAIAATAYLDGEQLDHVSDDLLVNFPDEFFHKIKDKRNPSFTGLYSRWVASPCITPAQQTAL